MDKRFLAAFALVLVLGMFFVAGCAAPEPAEDEPDVNDTHEVPLGTGNAGRVRINTGGTPTG